MRESLGIESAGMASSNQRRSGTKDDLQAPVQACTDLGLIEAAGDDVRLTPAGMFYADAVVSTLTMGLTSKAGAGLHTRDLLRERPQAADYIGMG